MKYGKLVLLCIFWGLIVFIGMNLFLGILLGSPSAVWRPEHGVWYCEELQMQISFEDGYNSFVFLEGRNVQCIWENNKGSKEITVCCQESGIAGYKLGDLIFTGLYISHSSNQYVVEDAASGQRYTFIRTGP